MEKHIIILHRVGALSCTHTDRSWSVLSSNSRAHRCSQWLSFQHTGHALSCSLPVIWESDSLSADFSPGPNPSENKFSGRKTSCCFLTSQICQPAWQTNCLCSCLLALLPFFCRNWGSGNQHKKILILWWLLWTINFLATLPGVSCLLPASMKLWVANSLA